MIRHRTVLINQVSSLPHITILTQRLVILRHLDAGLPLSAIQPLQIDREFSCMTRFQPPQVLHTTSLLGFLCWLHVAAASGLSVTCLTPPFLWLNGVYHTSKNTVDKTKAALQKAGSLASFQMKIKALPLHQAHKFTLQPLGFFPPHAL